MMQRHTRNKFDFNILACPSLQNPNTYLLTFTKACDACFDYSILVQKHIKGQKRLTDTQNEVLPLNIPEGMVWKKSEMLLKENVYVFYSIF